MPIFGLPLVLIFIFETIHLSQSLNSNIMQKITVMGSHAKPYVFDGRQSIKGVDVDIIENFARKLNLKAEYIIADEPLGEVFSNEQHFENFSQSAEFS